MGKTRRRTARIALALALIVGATALILAWGPSLADRVANRVAHHHLTPPSRTAQAVHDTAFVVDLHADTLLWPRDLTQRSGRGAVDIPRLIEGNVAIECFFLVTKSPYGLSIDYTIPGSDVITLLAFAQGWPRTTWNSLLERALYQAARFRELPRRTGGAFAVIETKSDLFAFREARARGESSVAGILGVEGAHVLEGDLDNLRALDAAGVRVFGLVHLFDNEAGGSAHGVDRGGLTRFGADLVRELESHGIAIDLAHASERTFDDVLAITTKPVLVSHTGVLGTCDNSRNLSDSQLRAVAATGGVVGIGFWDRAICGDEPRDVARAIRYAVDVAGVEHVGLGSDFDGGVPVAVDASGVGLVSAALADEGLSPEEIELILGQNAVRFFEATLPDEPG